MIFLDNLNWIIFSHLKDIIRNYYLMIQGYLWFHLKIALLLCITIDFRNYYLYFLFSRVNLTHIYTLLRVHCKYKFIVIKMLLSSLSAMDIGHQAKLHELLCSFFLKLLCYHFLLFHSFSIYNKHHSLLFFRFQEKH